MKKEWSIVSLFILAGLGVRLFLLRFDFVMNADGVAYTKMAQRLAHGDWYNFLDPYWSPLYPLMMSGIACLTDDLELPGQLTSLIFSGFLPLPVFLTARLVYGTAESLIAAALVSFYAFYLNVSLIVTPSTIYYFIFAWIVFCGWKALESSRAGWAAILGLLLGLAYLTRPEAIGYVPLFALLPAVGFGANTNVPLRRRVMLGALVAGIFLAVALPYLLYLKQATGNWTISAKVGPHLIGGNFSPVSAFGETQIPPDTFTATVKTIVSTLIFNFHKQHKIFPYIFPPLLIFLASIGLFGEKWSPKRRQHEIYLLFLFGLTFLAYVLTVVEPNYMGTYLVILLIWAARGITAIQRWASENIPDFPGKTVLFGSNPTFFALAAVVLVLVYVSPTLGIFRSPAQEREFVWHEVEKAGRWLRNRSGPDTQIMSNASQIPFYAGARHVPLKAPADRPISEQAKAANVDYLVISERTEKDLPELQNWLNGFPERPGIDPVYRDEDTPGSKLIIYRVIK